MTKVDIIAEFCQNHNGNYDTLARMVASAAQAGVAYGKIQTIYADEIAYRPQFEEGLTVGGVVKAIKRPYGPEYERLKKLELSDGESRRFITLCRDHGIKPLTTCFTRRWAKPLAEMGFESIKVASYDCASFPMLRELAALFGEIIVSTGATFDDEIETAASILNGKNFAFLHCVTLYPTPVGDANLARMDYLRALAPRVGYSDHSLVARDGLTTTLAAIHLGAQIVERHVTILPPDQTRDGPVSITPAQLRAIADFAAKDKRDQERSLDGDHPGWRQAIGVARRKLTDTELLNRDYYRGRFASPRTESVSGTRMIYNWEATGLP